LGSSVLFCVPILIAICLTRPPTHYCSGPQSESDGHQETKKYPG
jgi:hypothetical protein